MFLISERVSDGVIPGQTDYRIIAVVTTLERANLLIDNLLEPELSKSEVDRVGETPSNYLVSYIPVGIVVDRAVPMYSYSIKKSMLSPGERKIRQSSLIHTLSSEEQSVFREASNPPTAQEEFAYSLLENDPISVDIWKDAVGAERGWKE
jgi:hypothetical protein